MPRTSTNVSESTYAVYPTTKVGGGRRKNTSDERENGYGNKNDTSN